MAFHPEVPRRIFLLVQRRQDPSGYLRMTDTFRAPRTDSEQLQLRQIAAPHQKLINAVRCAPTLADRPHNKRLPATHVARAEHARDARHVVFVNDDVPTWV